MKKFSEILTETILEKESKRETDLIINEGMVDGFKKLASASKEKLSSFKDTFTTKAKDLLSKTLSSLVKSLVSSIQSKKSVDIKSQMEQNPMFKEFLSETDAINEISSDFDKKAVDSVIGKKGEVTEESVQYSNQNIISEGIVDSADTITTKIFSSVYTIIAKALGAIGYVIKPEFRNWYDRLIRKIQKKFYSTKLGQSIKDLPPEVEQDIMQKFQAIIGIVVVIVMVWIIVSTLNGDSNAVSNSAAGGATAEELDNAADNVDAKEIENASDNSGSGSEQSSTASDTTKTETNTNSGTEAAEATVKGGNASSTKMYYVPGGKDVNVKLSYADNPEVYNMRQKYISDRINAIKNSIKNTNPKRFSIARTQLQVETEYDYAFANGKILSIRDGNIIPIEANKFTESLSNPKAFLENTGALDGKTANLDALPSLYTKFNAEQLADAGVETINFNSYGVPVKIDLSKIPEADKSLNPEQLAQKYIKAVAEQAEKAKAEKEKLGFYL